MLRPMFDILEATIADVHAALARQNAEVPGGRVDAGSRELNLRTLGRFAHPRDFPDLVVASVKDSPVRLRDLGRVVNGQKELRTIARYDGRPAVVLTVQRQSGANTIAVIDGVKARLPRARETVDCKAERDGRVARIACRAVGQAAMLLGAGRETVTSAIDPAVGLVLHKKVGDLVIEGEPLVTLHVNDRRRLDEALHLLRQAFTVAAEAPERKPMIQAVLD